MIRMAAIRAVVGFIALVTPCVAQAGGGSGMVLLQAVVDGDGARIGEAIADGADLEARDANGRTALLVATRSGRTDLALALVEAGADVNAKDEIRDTPFLYAGAEGRNDILAAIIATGRANLADTNRYGGTALIPAAHHGHPETVRMLLDTDIDIDHVNDLGWTALMEAVILGDGGPVYQEIVGLLVDAGAGNIPDREGRTPLDHARTRGYEAIAERIEAGRQE